MRFKILFFWEKDFWVKDFWGKMFPEINDIKIAF